MSSNEKISPSGTFAFDYDLLGRQTLLRYPNGVEAGYGYDAAGQSTAVYHALGSYVVAYATYAYDNAGNRLSKYDLSGAHIYVYDVLHRLTVAVNLGPDGPVGAVETFEHDKAGNRIADSSGTVFDYDYANRIQWDNFYTYGHDANGNRISATGKLTGQTTSYVYDSENRRVEAHLPDGAVWTYKYDAKGRRIEKSLSGDTSKTLRYVYDNDDVLAILDGSNNLLALFTHGPGLGSPLAMRQGTTDYYYHADALGSVVALTNSSGSVVESYEYTAYGKPTVRDGSGTLRGMSAVGNSFMYGGGTGHDWETGQNHMGHREQDPDAGTFMQEDPIGLAGGDVNLYAYVDFVGKPSLRPNPYFDGVEFGSANLYQYAYNNSVRYTDPYGTWVYLGAAGVTGSALVVGYALYLAYGTAWNIQEERDAQGNLTAVYWDAPASWERAAFPYSLGLRIDMTVSNSRLHGSKWSYPSRMRWVYPSRSAQYCLGKGT